LGVEPDSGAETGSLLGFFFSLLDLLGDSLALSVFSLLDSVLVLAFSDFLAGSSAAVFSLLDSAFVDEGLDVSFAGLRVLAGALGDEAAGGVVRGAGLLSGVPNGLTAAVAAGVSDAAAVEAAVMLGVVVALVVDVAPVVVALVTPTLNSALKRGAGTP